MNRSSVPASSSSPASRTSVERLLDEGPRLRALALSLVRDPHEADDLVQETWARALERPPRHTTSPAGWLATVLRNLVRDRARVDGRRARRERAVATHEYAPSAAALAAQADAHRRLLEAVLDLDEPYRETVLLRFFEGLGPKEIGERTGTPSATVRSRLHRALRLLRGELEEDLGKEWRRALVPVPPAVGGAPAGASATGGPRLFHTGAWIVTTKQKLTAAAVLLLLLLAGGAALTLEPDHTSSTALDGLPEVAVADGIGSDVARPRGAERSRPGSSETGDVVGSPATVDPDEPTADPTPERLTIADTVAVDARLVRRLPIEEEPAAADGAGASGGATISTSGGSTLSRGASVTPWDFVKPAGDVTVRGRVLGSDGAPVPGAHVLRVHLGDDDAPLVRHGSIRYDLAGSTRPDGTFSFRDQPPGRWMLVADFRQLQRVGGRLDVGLGQKLELQPGSTRTDVELRVPVAAGRFGSVTVRLSDVRGRPLEGKLVSLPPQVLITDRAGRVFFHGVEPGDHVLRVKSVGLRVAEREVAVTPKSSQEVDLTAEYEDTGTSTFGGRVVDDRGKPLAGARVFLGRPGVSRDTRTDADGRFRLTELPPAMSAEPVVLWAYPDATLATHSAFRREIQLPAPDVEAVVQRHATLHLHLRDTVTDDPVDVCQLKLRLLSTPDGETRDTELPGGVGHTDDGLLVVRGPPGTLRLTLDSPDHQGVVVDGDLPDADAIFETTVELDPLQ